MEEDGVHDLDDEEPDGSGGEEDEGHLIAVDGDPPGHPAQ